MAFKNTKELIKHLNDCLDHLYKERFPGIRDYLPMQVMYRCSMLAYSLIFFELFAILDPAKVSVDPFELLKTRGCFQFQAFCGPTGFLGELDFNFFHYYLREKKHGRTDIRTLQSVAVAEAWGKFQQGLLTSSHKSFRVKNSVFTFREVWNEIIPKPIRSDR